MITFSRIWSTFYIQVDCSKLLPNWILEKLSFSSHEVFQHHPGIWQMPCSYPGLLQKGRWTTMFFICMNSLQEGKLARGLPVSLIASEMKKKMQNDQNNPCGTHFVNQSWTERPRQWTIHITSIVENSKILKNEKSYIGLGKPFIAALAPPLKCWTWSISEALLISTNQISRSLFFWNLFAKIPQ